MERQEMESRNKQFIYLTLVIFLLIGLLNLPGFSASNNNSKSDYSIEQSLAPVPSGYRHRPIIEFFTGLSCPACMSGPDQDLEQLWEENGGIPEQPFTYVVFHELNGGGVDDLATEESKERMQYYQPGVAGTPDAEFDGGYIKLGGLSANSIDYGSASQALEDCKSRYQRSFNPLHPLQSIRNELSS
jgi:hypothetical protein